MNNRSEYDANNWLDAAVTQTTSSTGQRPWRGVRRPTRLALWPFVTALVYVLAVAAVAADVFVWRP